MQLPEEGALRRGHPVRAPGLYANVPMGSLSKSQPHPDRGTIAAARILEGAAAGPSCAESQASS